MAASTWIRVDTICVYCLV